MREPAVAMALLAAGLLSACGNKSSGIVAAQGSGDSVQICVLISELRFRCTHCGRRTGFAISLADGRHRGDSTKNAQKIPIAGKFSFDFYRSASVLPGSRLQLDPGPFAAWVHFQTRSKWVLLRSAGRELLRR